ncbi:expressed unknown protein [Seminavis robusta]|uniref:Uncharacterized protein n=1 Tax=Seminavis robusta TaxID=568900 RepID=A0A9N8D936_9STRA|nr:expressed unknown protein [Seminavis robusta]|eukprot:Sro37_g023160.1 n/a (222) ;mRNA; f:44162-44926
MGEPKKGFFIDDEMESPRMVTAADRWGSGLSPSIPMEGDGGGCIQRTGGWKLRPKLSSGKGKACLSGRLHSNAAVGSNTATHNPRSITVVEDSSPDPFDMTLMELESNKANNWRANGGSIARSKAIAITRKRDDTHVVDDHIMQTCSSMERMYDWATWKMYERITYHRRHYPVRYSSEATSVTPRYNTDPPPSASEEKGTDEVDHAKPERYFDGEIFDLEI